ncbi:molybdopterin-dependent oxidoreductase, partial [Dietzia sp.]|uniref:molybdopterin-dependent oxidoreductase n=1 Tax=Dietzia sp. TaxID=1871616 RepID=UPI002FD99F08
MAERLVEQETGGGAAEKGTFAAPGAGGRGDGALRALLGIVAAAIVAAVGHLVAGGLAPDASPVVAVGDAVVDLSPTAMREFAIRTFGTADKAALFAGMGAILVVLTAGGGLAERPGRPLGSVLIGALALVGAAAEVTRPPASWVWLVPSLLGGAAGIAVLRWGVALLEPTGARARKGAGAGAGNRPGAASPDRRRFLGVLGGAAALAATAYALGGALARSAGDVVAERLAFALPGVRPELAARPIPAGVEVAANLEGATPFLTPNDEFYRIDTALRVPAVTAADWSLRIHGMVEREITVSWDELLRRTAKEAVVTLTCVSNEVGGGLAGNAKWTGFPMAELLAEAGVSPDADMLLSTSADGWTCGTPLAALVDGRDAILAVGMNDEPLPVEHGYPVRQVIPGLYGYVSATKWVVDWEVTRFDQAHAYWSSRGWSEKGPIKTASRIDRPKDGRRLDAGRNVLAGTAWAQHRGVSRVEV